MAQLTLLPVLVLFPVAEIAMKLVDPLIVNSRLDGAVDLAFMGIEAYHNNFCNYEKTKPPTYPVSSCAYGSSCKDRFLKCPCFHQYSDCPDYINDKRSCNGECRKYHRKFVGGRGLSSSIRANQPITITRSQYVPSETQVWGKVSVGVKWDFTKDEFKAKRAVGDFSNVICKTGEWQDLNLSAGIFSLNGELLQGIYYDDSANIFHNARDNYKNDFFGGSVHHNGNDLKGGPAAREKPGNYGFNEVIDINFDKIPDHVGAIVVSLNCYSSTAVAFLENSEITIFVTPQEASTSPGPTILSLKLEPKDELAVQPGYLFGKFIRSAIGWKFVPIRANLGLNSNVSTVQQAMKPHVQETMEASIPIDSPEDASYIELDVLSFTKDRRFSIPIKQIGFICFDIFGRKMDIKPPFFIVKQEDSGGLQLKYHSDHDTKLSSIFFYVDHGDDIDVGVTKGDTTFVVGKAGDPVMCGIGNLGASKQLIARILGIGKSRWDITTFAIPLNKEKSAESAALDSIYARRLVPLVDSKLKVLRDLLIPASPVATLPCLIVEVLYGKSLAVKDFKTSDPFVVVKFESQKFKTEVEKSTLSPIWNAKFKFDIENLHSDITMLNFRCKDWNKLSKAVSMGVAQFDLMDLTSRNYNKEMNLELKQDPEHPKQSFAGYITVKVYFSD